MFKKLLTSLAHIAASIAAGIADATNTNTNTNQAKTMNCGVCNMPIPRDAQICPYCREQPNCYKNKIYD